MSKSKFHAICFVRTVVNIFLSAAHVRHIADEVEQNDDADLLANLLNCFDVIIQTFLTVFFFI